MDAHQSSIEFKFVMPEKIIKLHLYYNYYINLLLEKKWEYAEHEKVTNYSIGRCNVTSGVTRWSENIIVTRKCATGATSLLVCCRTRGDLLEWKHYCDWPRVTAVPGCATDRIVRKLCIYWWYFQRAPHWMAWQHLHHLSFCSCSKFAAAILHAQISWDVLALTVWKATKWGDFCPQRPRSSTYGWLWLVLLNICAWTWHWHYDINWNLAPWTVMMIG